MRRTFLALYLPHGILYTLILLFITIWILKWSRKIVSLKPYLTLLTNFKWRVFKYLIFKSWNFSFGILLVACHLPGSNPFSTKGWASWPGTNVKLKKYILVSKIFTFNLSMYFPYCNPLMKSFPCLKLFWDMKAFQKPIILRKNAYTFKRRPKVHWKHEFNLIQGDFTKLIQ